MGHALHLVVGRAVMEASPREGNQCTLALGLRCGCICAGKLVRIRLQFLTGYSNYEVTPSRDAKQFFFFYLRKLIFCFGISTMFCLAVETEQSNTKSHLEEIGRINTLFLGQFRVFGCSDIFWLLFWCNWIRWGNTGSCHKNMQSATRLTWNVSIKAA